MKSFLSLLVGIGLFPLGAQTVQTPGELQVRSDLDGDGREDLVIIERATGSFRVGYQLVGGELTWSRSRASGAAGASWAAAGDLAGNPGSLAIATPVAGFVSVIEAPLADSPVVPVLVYPGGVGPRGVIAADIGGAGNTADDDLIVFTGLNGQAPNDRRELIRHTGGGSESYATLGEEAGGVFQAGQRTVIENGGDEYVAVLEGPTGSATLRFFETGAGAMLDEKGSASGLPGSGFLSGKFGPGAYHQFLFWEAGEETVAWRQSSANGVGDVQLTGGGNFSTGLPVGQLILVEGGVAPRFLVISEDGVSAMLFNFDGNSISFVQEFVASVGRDFTGAFVGPDGALTLLHGASGTGLSSSWTKWNPSGQGYQEGVSGDLPSLLPAGTRANVFLFVTEPFVTPDPGLVATLNAPEWSSNVTLTGNPKNLSAVTEVFIGSSSGLGSASPHPLGSAPAGASFAMGNQLRADTSLGSLQLLLGPAGMTVEISPPGGTYDKAVKPTVSGLPASLEVFARADGGPWIPAANFQPHLTTTTVVQAYAREAGGTRKTPIRSVTYTFEMDPMLIDSDDDGVPDFVELSSPQNPLLDPNQESDTDRDGYSDLEEWLADTDPLDPASRPVTRAGNSHSFIVRGELQPLDGTTGQVSSAALGVGVEILSPEGKRLGGAETRLGVPGFVNDPAFEMDRLFTDSSLVAILSQPVFEIATPDVDKNRGRELAALIPVPKNAREEISYVPGGGSVMAEVAAWKAAAQAAAASSQPVVVSRQISEQDVLVSLLFERWLNEVSLARGLAGVTNDNVRLFPSRAGDAGRRVLTGEEMAGLRTRQSDSLPGWDVVKVLADLELAIPTTLAEVATEIYRISSELSVGEDAPDFRPPLDVLRDFVRTGNLPGAYAAEIQVSPADRASASQQATALLAALSPRPVITVELEVTPQTFVESCPLLEEVGTLDPFSLLSRSGLAYQFPPGFTLVPGARVEVQGHTDLVESGCAGAPLEVLSMRVTFLPTPPVEDLDENLLIDAWEDFFSMIIDDPLGDLDGDGFSNLQEMLDGTDPLLAESKGDQPANLAPPQVKVIVQEGGEVVVEWDFPADYADQIVFTLFKSETLQDFVPLVPDVSDQGGNFQVTLPAPGEIKQFYQVAMSLKK